MIVTSKSSNRKRRILAKDAVLKVKNAKPRIVLGLVMSISMATVLSFVITLSYIGFTPNFLSIWVNRLTISLAVGPPIALMLLPLAMKFVDKIVRESRRNTPI